MKYVAFFRNVNLGQGNSPTRAQLEQAFQRAGAVDPRSFLSNGTVIFEAGSAAAARQQLAAAGDWLRRQCGLTEPACVRPLARVAALARSEVFAGHATSSVYAHAVSFACARGVPALRSLGLPQTSPRGDVVVLHTSLGDVLSLSVRVARSAGNPNAYLERLTGVPFTTRVWRTVQRIADRHG